MATTTATIDVAVTGLQSLDRLNNSFDRLHNQFGNIRTAILGLGLAAVGKQAMEVADQLIDMSAATGIAVGRIYEFKGALQAAGGDPGQFAQALNRFVLSVDEAAQGSLKAQNQFRELGVTLDDLRTQGENDLLIKTLEGIAAVGDKSRQSALMVERFGKSFRTVNVNDLLQTMKETAGSADDYADAIKRASDLNGTLEIAQNKLRIAILEAFSGPIKLLDEFATAVLKNKASMDTLIATLKILGIILAATFGAGVGLILVRTLGTIMRGIAAIGPALTAVRAAFSGVSTAAGVLASAALFTPQGAVLKSLRGIVLAIAAIGAAIGTAAVLFDSFGARVVNVMARSIEAVGDFAAMLLNMPTDVINKMFGTDITGLGTPLQQLVEKAKKHREAYEKEVQKTRDATKKGSTETPQIDRFVDTTAFDTAVAGIKRIGVEFDNNNQRIREQAKLDASNIGRAKEEADLRKEEFEILKRTQDQVRSLTQAKAQMSKELREAGLGKFYDQEIANIERLGKEEQKRARLKVEYQNLVERAFQVELFTTRSRIDLENKIQEEINQTAKVGLGELEQKYYDIEAAAKLAAKAAIQAEEARILRPLRPEEAQQFTDIALRGVEKLQDATRKALDTRNTFENAKAFYDLGIRQNTEIRNITADIAEISLSDYDRRLRAIDRVIQGEADIAVERLRAQRGPFAVVTEEERQAIVERLNSIFEAQRKVNEELVRKQRDMEIAVTVRNKELDVAQNIRDIQTDIADLTLSDTQKRLLSIDRLLAKETEILAIRIAQQRGPLAEVTDEDRAAARERLTGVFQKLKDQNEELVRQSRNFSTGWKKAFNDYVDAASNASARAERLFKRATQGMEDAIINFVKTGKFEWKDFVNMMVEELLRAQIQQLMGNMIGGIQGAAQNSSLIGGGLNMLGGVLGLTGGAGGKGQTASNPLYVMDVRGGGQGGMPSFFGGGGQSGQGGGIVSGIKNVVGGIVDTVGNIGKSIGNVITGGGIGGGQSGGIIGGLKNVVGGIVDTVGNLGSSIGKVFSGGSSGGGILNTIANVGSSILGGGKSLLSGIGDFFSGFFANGGNIPAGTFGIVGERGPEFISGPATITPMSGATQVTYNINAVDAASFQALVARDPAFIHAVAEQGRRTQPMTRR